MAEHKTTIQKDKSLPIKRKCTLLDVSRSTLYYKPVEHEPDLEKLEIKRLMDKFHTKYPFMGSHSSKVEVDGLVVKMVEFTELGGIRVPLKHPGSCLNFMS